MEFDLLSYTVFFVAAFLGGFIDAIAGGGGLITLPAIMAMGVHLILPLAQTSFKAYLAASRQR